MNKSYILTKDSKPGFVLKTDHLEVVRTILDLHVCDMCKGLDPNHRADMNIKEHNKTKAALKELKEKEPKNQDKQKIHDLELSLVQDLKSTSCGLEFNFETVSWDNIPGTNCQGEPYDE